MADINIDASINVAQVKAGTRTVVDSIDKIEKKTTAAQKTIERQSRRMRGGGRKGGRGGMAVLEASRAIEDYSVAGMRGALNNIPTLIQSIAPAMTAVAGATSVAVVAVWKLTEALEGYLDKQQEMREGRAARGIKFLDVEPLIKEARDAADELKLSFAEQNTMIERERGIESAKTRTKFAKEELDLQEEKLRKILELTQNGASEADIRREVLALDKQILAVRARAEAAQVDVSEQSLAKKYAKAYAAQDDVLAGIAAQQRLRDMVDPKAKVAAEREARGAALEAAKRLYGPIGRTSRNKKQDLENTLKREAFINERMDAFQKANEVEVEALKTAIQRGAAQEAILQRINAIIAAEEYSLGLQREKNKESANARASEERQLDYQEKLRQASKIDAYNRFRMRMGVDSNGLLSSAGRSGLGAAEATNSLNIQRSMHLVLKSIDRSLKGKLISVAG